jgi:Bacterial Ig domain
MNYFSVDDMKSDGCTVCCCEPLALKPGSTSKVLLNYAPWAVPIGRLHCMPIFELVQMETCGAATGAPVKTGGLPVAFDTPINTTLEGDLKTKIEDPDTPIKFRHLSFYGPHHGTLLLEPDGLFDYEPTPGYEGPDRFFFTATDNNGHQATFEALIGVGSTSSVDMKETPHVYVDARSANVDYQYYTASFAVTVSPAADLCEVWRLNVAMQAIDCQCICYNRTDCYDIRLVKC